MQAAEFRARFARNFNTLLDHIGAPTSGFGRVKYVAELFAISTSGAGKWISGASLPDAHRYDEVCMKLQCSMDELLGEVLSRKIELNEPTPLATVPVSLLGSLLGWNSATIFLMKVQDDTSEPYVIRGDVVFIQPVKEFEGPGSYLIETPSRSITIRRLLHSATEHAYVLTPGNFGAEIIAQDRVVFTQPSPPNSVLVIGKIIGRLLNGR